MTEAQPGWAASPPMATSSRLTPCSAAHLLSASTRSSFGSVTYPGRLASRAARDRRLAALDLAGEQAVGQRVVRQHTQPEVPGRGHQFRFGRPLQQRPLVLRGDERLGAGLPGQMRGVGGLPAGQVRVTEVAHLALGDQLTQRVQRLLDRGLRVRGVQLVQVQVVGAQAAERGGHGAPDVGPAALGPGGGPVAHVHLLVAELGGQHDLVAAAAQQLAEHLLGTAAVAVDVRGVEQGDARVDGRVHHGPGLLQVQPAAEVVAAEPGHRYEQPAITHRPEAHDPASAGDDPEPG